MSIEIKATVLKRPRPADALPWVAYAKAIETTTGMIIRSTLSSFASSHAEAMQLAQVARERLDNQLMDEVHASRSARRTRKVTK